MFDENGNELPDYKAVANEDQKTEIFSVVKNGYQVIQHEDVFKTVEDAIADKNLNAVPRVNSNYNGDCGRLHIEVTFEDIKLDIDNDGLKSNLYCTYDNSYDGTTGLRLSVGAKRGNAVLWIVGSRYYHKHTKGVSVASFEDSLEKGIDAFQTKIKGHFMGMFNTPLTNASAEDFITNCEGVKGISNTYVEKILAQVKESTVKNKWQLYCIICESVTKNASSIDVRDRHLQSIIGRMHRVIKSADEKVDTPSTPEGGVTLAEVAKDHVVKSDLEVNDLPTSKLPEGVLCLELNDTPPKLTIDRQGKRKFVVRMGDTNIKTFKKYRQASKYIQKAA